MRVMIVFVLMLWREGFSLIYVGGKKLHMALDICRQFLVPNELIIFWHWRYMYIKKETVYNRNHFALCHKEKLPVMIKMRIESAFIVFFIAHNYP